MPAISSVVSGHTEAVALPVLLRRVVHERLQRFDVLIRAPQRAPEGKLTREGDPAFAAFLSRAARGADAVLVLIDDDHAGACPKQDAPRLQARADAEGPGKPVSVVLAYPELEAWLLWDSENLFGAPAGEPEVGKGAKGRLERLRSYHGPTDAPALFDRLDIDRVVARSDSFRVFVDRVTRLCAALQPPSGD
jgi:hypothetical protein